MMNDGPKAKRRTESRSKNGCEAARPCRIGIRDEETGEDSQRRLEDEKMRNEGLTENDPSAETVDKW